MAKAKKRVATRKKAKKRVATRKKASKRGKASAKSLRKKVARRATPKKRLRKTSAKKAPRKVARQKAVPVIEDTIIDVIEEPVPGVVRVTEYETIRMTTPKRGPGPETEEE